MLSRENPKAIRQYQQKSGKSPGNQVKEKFLRAVKRTATLLFLGSLTMLLLGALVYLAATGGPPERNPVPRSEGWSCCGPGPGRPANPQSRLWLWRVTSASCPSGPAGRSLGPGWPFGTDGTPASSSAPAPAHHWPTASPGMRPPARLRQRPAQAGVFSVEAFRKRVVCSQFIRAATDEKPRHPSSNSSSGKVGSRTSS